MPAHLTPILVLAACIAGAGLVLWLHHRLDNAYRKSNPKEEKQPDGTETAAEVPSESEAKENKPGDGEGSGNGEGECCGMHIVCERDSLSTAVQDAEDYYDDEELDAYAGRAADAYEPEETEAFRDVLLTLKPEEIAPWARAIQRRGITLPSDVREELLMIVAEARQNRKPS